MSHLEAVPNGRLPPIVADSVTQLSERAFGRVLICGSHGGRFSAACAIVAGVAGVVFNDAGVGLDRAGIAGLALLDDYGIPGATVDRQRSLIGVAAQTASGTLSHVNFTAGALGLTAGMLALRFDDCVALARAPARSKLAAPRIEECRTLLIDGSVPVWAIDSASLARPGDEGAVLVTGSHGQLVGGDADGALRANPRIAIFNDAGGLSAPSRLEALHARGVAAVTVAASSARIGDARSSYFDGVISAVNTTAAADGARVSTTARAYVTSLLAGPKKEAVT